MAQPETPQCKTEHGIWYAAPSYDAGADETTFTVEPLANLASFQVGYKVLLDTRTPTYHTITAAGGDTFTVKGQLTPTMGNTDAHEIGSAGDWFRVMTPYGKDAQTGELDQELSMKGSRQGLWGGYRWMPPEGPNGSTASFSNKYYCHNRTYDTRTGRWSTPDPAASPWWNLQDYVGGRPLDRSDPSGLFWYSKHGRLTEEALMDSTVPECLHKQVIRGSKRIDYDGTHDRETALHVDDTRVLGETERWLMAIRAAGDYIRAQNGQADCKCLASLARIAGMGAHTIQDFYHHTDWFFGGGGDVRNGENEITELKRWDETKKGASRVKTGYGYIYTGEFNGIPQHKARRGAWHHDPWTDGEKMPLRPSGLNGKTYLAKAVKDVVVPHSRSFLKSVLGGIPVGCCCPEGKLSASPGTLESAKHLTDCFGAEAGGELARTLAYRMTTYRPDPNEDEFPRRPRGGG